MEYYTRHLERVIEGMMEEAGIKSPPTSAPYWVVLETFCNLVDYYRNQQDTKKSTRKPRKKVKSK